MITYGFWDTDFFVFAPEAVAKGYPIHHTELVKTLTGDGRVDWVPTVQRTITGAARFMAEIQVNLGGNLTIVDMSSYHAKGYSSLRTNVLEPGCHSFQIFQVTLPRRWDREDLTIALLSGTTYGLMWHGLLKAVRPDDGYWEKQIEYLKLLRILAAFRRQIARKTVRYPDLPPWPQVSEFDGARVFMV